MTNPQNKPTPRRVLKILLIVLAVIAITLAAVAGGYAWLYYQGRQSLHASGNISTPSHLVDGVDGDLVIYQGKTYQYNHNITAILVMGVDKQNIQTDGQYGENGQADSLFLMAMDTQSGAVHMVPISREAMVDVNLYAMDGSYSGVEKTQLCLAYAYAASGEEGCRNVTRSVSRLLYGVPIEKYVAIDLAGLSTLTDVIGGVPVTTLEDLELNGTLVKKGQTLTLNGKQAINYIQERDQDTEANVRRMARQKQFLTSFMDQAGQLLQENMSRLPGLYNTAKPYIVSNVTLSELTYLATNTLPGGNWRRPSYHTITGQSVLGEKHVEFHADSASVYEAVLATFYTPVD